MPIDLVSRSEWGARAPTGSYGSMPDPVSGVKVHYTGSTENPALLTDHSLCDNRVRSIQNGHMDGNGWIDIGYSYVVCHHRKVFVGRGLHHLPAANGAGLNSGHYAVCALVGSSGITQPTDDLLHGIRDAIEYIRANAPAGSQIKGHRDGYSTDCPGDPLYSWVQAGAPRPNTPPSPPPPTGDEMDIVSLGLVQDAEIPAVGAGPPPDLSPVPVKFQPWWTDEFSDASNWHPSGGQSIAPSVSAWGHFTTQLWVSNGPVDVSFVRVNPDGSFVDTAWGPYRFDEIGPRGYIEVNLNAQFKLNGSTRARVQIENWNSEPVLLKVGSMFKAFLFRD